MLQILITAVLIVCICSLAVILTLAFRPLYYLDMDFLNNPKNAGLDAETVKRNYDVLIDYNLSFTENALRFPDLPMSKGGEQHFQEVKEIFSFFKICIIRDSFLSEKEALFASLFCGTGSHLFAGFSRFSCLYELGGTVYRFSSFAF